MRGADERYAVGRQAAAYGCHAPRCQLIADRGAEIHDAFSICELMVLEDLGFVKKGKSGSFIRDLFMTNSKKINPRGGLIGAGHPLGATGIAQIAEISSQLQGRAEKRQADKPRIGLVQNMSAAATSSTVLVMQN